ncbi:glycosyltransferase family 4 protein [uncultured Thiodictyon sp.]|uniref:glycosyltransferase family 4 protein n=1 Tax=uncultured Thiodictyon sp. TaxID=1846217 RepID=UPI0025ED427F|nr:glycosyltransferase family 4 protein [uncultured Thiodictyon sp.]
MHGAAWPQRDVGAWRVAWLTESYPPDCGGMAQSCDRIVRGLRAAGVELDLLHCAERLRRWEEQRQVGGRYFACPMDGDPAHALNRLWARLEREADRYTHLVAFGGALPLLAAPVYAAWMDRPLIALLRGNDLDAALFHPARAQVLARALTAATLVGCVSRSQARKTQALYPGLNTRWIPNGIDLRDWTLHPFDLERARLWRDEVFPPQRLVIGCFGHLKAKKGLLLLLEALRGSRQRERFHCLLVGEITPEAADWIERECADLSLTVLPFLDRFDLLPLYAACDYVALPSFYDGMPNVMLEALGLGLPLIAARAGGMADLLTDGVQGLLFDPGDMHGARDALTRAAGVSADERRRMGEAGRALAADRLGAERETSAYFNLLAEAAALGRDRDTCAR